MSIVEIYNRLIEKRGNLSNYTIEYINENKNIRIRRKNISPQQIITYNPDLTIDNFPVKYQFIIESNDMLLFRDIYVRIIDETDKSDYYLPQKYHTTLSMCSQIDIMEIIDYIKKTEYDLYFNKFELQEPGPYNQTRGLILMEGKKSKPLEFTELRKNKIQPLKDEYNNFKHDIKLCSHLFSDYMRTKIPDDIKKCVFENSIS